jgi:Bacterial dnaA protein helix-turn-helix
MLADPPLDAPSKPAPFSRPHRSTVLDHPALPRLVIERAVAHVFAVELSDLEAATRGKKEVAFARQVAMYLAHITCGLTLTETGQLFMRDRTTVAHACSLVEDRRDDASFDLALDFLDRAIGNLLRPWCRQPDLRPDCHCQD